MKKSLFALLFCLVARQAPAARLGESAPGLDIAHWIQGEPVKLDGSKILVLEFWATWCGPCRASIPHLSEIQKKYRDKDVVIIGITDETPAKIKPFVEKMGEKMNYTVAIETDQNMFAAYMVPFNQTTIPQTFVIDKKNRIVWRGHPENGLEKALDQILVGTYDLETMANRDEGYRLFSIYHQMVLDGKDRVMQDQIAHRITVLDRALGGLLPGQKLDMVSMRSHIIFEQLDDLYPKALRAKDAVKIAALEKKILENAPKDFDFASFKQDVVLRMGWNDYYDALADGKDEATLKSLTAQIASTPTKNADLLNEIAWDILTDREIKKRDYDLAHKLAKAAYEHSGKKDAAIIDTYAKAAFESGQAKAAVRIQREAVKHETDEATQKEYAATLKKYEAKLTK